MCLMMFANVEFDIHQDCRDKIAMWYGTSWINHIPSFDIKTSVPQLINAHLPIRTCAHVRQPHAIEVWKWDDNAEFQLKSADSKNKLHVQGCSQSI